MTALEIESKSGLDDSTDGKHHIKGTAVRNFKNYVEVKIGESFFKHLLTSVELSKTGKILPSSWYNVHKYVRMHQMTAEAMNMSTRDMVIDFTRYHLEIDMNGVYRFFMKMGGPQRVLTRVPSIDKAYSDYTKMEILSSDKGRCISVIHVPEQLSQWYLWTLEGGFMGVLNVCGSAMTSFEKIKEESYRSKHDLIHAITMEIKY